MIEFFSSRRMIVVIGVLILLCIIIVILEDSIADNVDKPTPYLEHYHRQLNKTIATGEIGAENKSTISSIKWKDCWENEEYSVVGRCWHCSKQEAQLPACLTTGYHEQVRCKQSGTVFRSCDTVTSLFWTFHFFMLCVSVVFNLYVRKRQSLLNRLILNKIEKQLSSGV